jgi:RimJ/RimL family protein N-acetyltransferase
MPQAIDTAPVATAGRVVIETARLTLRMPETTDAAAIAAIANDLRVAENLRRLPHPYSQADAAAFLERIAGSDRERVFLIARRGETIGMVGLDLDEPDRPELGYWLGHASWGRGFATEAARAAIDYAFETFDIARIAAGARVTNPASRRILEKCGFQWRGVELHRFLALGFSTPVDRFRLERGVWASLKDWSAAKRSIG